MNISKEKISSFFLVFSYVFITLIGTNFLAGEGHILDSSDTGDSDVLKQFLFFLVFLLVIVDCFIKGKLSTIRSIDNIYIYVILFFSYALTSVLWSNVPFISFKRIVLTIIVFLIPFFLVLSYSGKVLFDSLVQSLFVIILLSFIFCLTHPGAVHSFDTLDEQLIGNWKGLFSHKNRAGAVSAVLTGILSIYFFVTKDKKYLLFSLISVLFLFQTMSKTSLFIVIPSILFSFALVRWRFISNKYFLFAVVLLFSPLFYWMITTFLFLLESPESFTGRSMVWQVVIDIIQDNPIFGVGYSSVYHVGNNSILYDYAGNWVEFVAHGHNGYLDLVLYLGLLGLLGFLCIFILPYFAISIKLAREGVSQSDYIVLVSSIFVGVFFLLHNFSETSFFDTTRHGWVFISFFFAILIQINASKRVI